ncbi:hypothetical protein A2215_01970 [Candidatus Berkelbacteria bacterium RIFOXYA2_FULL_43_10]|uniref:Pyrrolo-quinoline quinone repeat domain-containing protein n=1 Tax=Candidatus Berkelbacteria bacterium RIFOXYA2_FULL_43_10 TaxID=1797472 RepID=A0A1F5E4A6_9BACT|nr:MAG: hypothetical protein A2215_01970 [Candidatus Berkelbacteria bacterium RIFOXYA2_FULL_43_10]
MNLLTKFIAVVAGAAVVVLPLEAQASNWETFRSSNTNDATVFDNTDSSSFASKTFEIDGAGSFTTPIMAEGMLFFAKRINATNLNEVNAVSLSDGSIIWQKTYTRQIQRLLYDNGKIYFGADKFYCLNASDGSEVWSQGQDMQGDTITWAYVFRIANNIVLGWSEPTSGKKFLALNASNGSVVNDLGRRDFEKVREVVVDGSNFYFNLVSGSGTSIHTDIESYSLSDFSQNWTTTESCPSDSANILIDSDEDMIYLSSGSYRFCGFDQNTGARYFYTPNSPLRTNFSKYGDRIFAFSATTNGAISSFDPKAKNGNASTTMVLENETFSSAPTIVNDVIYGGTNLGRIWGMNMESGEKKLWDLGESGDYINYIAYADGRFAIRAVNSTNPKIYLVDASTFDLAYPDQYTISLESPYKTDGVYNSYLGQLHAHWIPDNPTWSQLHRKDPEPGFVADQYDDKGYQFVALTEHNLITDYSGGSDLLSFKYAEEDTQDYGGNHILAIGITETIDENDSDQNRIDQIIDQSGGAVLAHPSAKYYKIDLLRLLELKNYIGLEGYNYAIDVHKVLGSSYAFEKYDDIITTGKKIWVTAGDDSTPGNYGIDGAAVVVFSKDLNQSEILQNLKDGNFYAVQGSKAPRMGVSVSGNEITVTSDQVGEIKFIGKGGAELQKEEGVTSSTYSVNGDEIYIRAEVESTESGKKSWSQPIFVKKVRARDTSSYGKRYISLGSDASLVSNTTEAVEAKTLDANQYPTQTPPSGYFSQIYSLITSGQVLEGTKLSFNYAKDMLTTNEDNLSIYSFNEAGGVWEKVPSVVDKSSQTVSADLSHFSLYALSAETPADIVAPSLSLLSPVDLTNLSGEVELKVNATDNDIVSRVDFAVDDIAQTSDTDLSDGWSALLDMDDYSTGEHTLTISAEDPAGNSSVIDYQFSVANSAFIAPTAEISMPLVGEYLKGIFNIAGSFSAQNELQSISVYLDDVFIEDADINLLDDTISKSIDWDQFREGEHTLRVELIDGRGNVTNDSILVNIGEEQNVEIISPEEGIYMHSETIPIQFAPEDSTLVAKLDGVEVANNSSIKLLDYTLGEHTLTVEKESTVLAERKFSISTNLDDLKKTTTILYNENHITNKGIYLSILLHIQTAKFFEDIGWIKLRDRMLENLQHFIIVQSKGKFPKIDEYARNVLVGEIEWIKVTY